jgi:hypothetical protein
MMFMTHIHSYIENDRAWAPCGNISIELCCRPGIKTNKHNDWEMCVESGLWQTWLSQLDLTSSEDLTQLDVQNNTLYCLVLWIHYTSLFFQDVKSDPTLCDWRNFARIFKGVNSMCVSMFLVTVTSSLIMLRVRSLVVYAVYLE